MIIHSIRNSRIKCLAQYTVISLNLYGAPRSQQHWIMTWAMNYWPCWDNAIVKTLWSSMAKTCKEKLISFSPVWIPLKGHYHSKKGTTPRVHLWPWSTDTWHMGQGLNVRVTSGLLCLLGQLAESGGKSWVSRLRCRTAIGHNRTVEGRWGEGTDCRRGAGRCGNHA